MKTRHYLLLTYLNDVRWDITTKELFERMTEHEQQMMDNVKRASAELNVMRNWQWVENGISEIIDGHTRLTWRITKAGQDALQTTENPMTKAEHNELKTSMALSLEQAREWFVESVNGLFTKLETHFDEQPTIEINNAELKIETLDKLRPLLSSDIGDVLSDIIDDIKRIAA